jgi:putative nucleotidyltransferase with HDIG domain
MSVTSFEANLEVLMASGQQLPSLPTMLIQVQRAMANENGGLADLGRLIEQDPALTTRLLRMANSAFFNRGDQVTSITAALNRLGMVNVRSLCIAVGVIKAFGDSQHALDHRRYWQHSAAVGLVAEHLARVGKRYAAVDGSEAYTAGLLHDVGVLILDQFFPALFASIRADVEAQGIGRWHVETAELGMDHGQVGARLLGHWRLPEPVIAAVREHHQGPEAVVGAGLIGHLVWGAEALCSAGGLELTEEGVAEVTPGEVFDRLGIGADDRPAVLERVGKIGDQALSIAA